ncbi:DNA polymerase III subunit delta' [Pseudomonas sp. F1_0610]|uniref:DNA polymerase III subunit delta' n=1 Tax=Pseudomonas sp. F1_0610 TaxID=3114284 RepID=UPI0039C411AB
MSELFPWQQSMWQQLTANSQFAHAYLFYGHQGIGKRQFVECFAALLLCQKPQQKACGHCSSCRLLAAQTHPDFFHLAPEEEGKSIVIGQVRELVADIAQTAQQGGRQVVIVEPTEAMTLGASNALLKNLEEPSGSTVFLLVSDQISFLLPTIKSRCVLQKCTMPNNQQALDWLKSAKPDIQDNDLQAALALAGNSPLKALSLLELDVLAQYERVVEGVKKLFKQQVTASDLALAWAKIPQEWLINWFADWTQAILRFKLTQDMPLLETNSMFPVIKYLAEKTQLEPLIEVQNWLLDHRQKVLKRVPLRADLLFEGLLYRWLGLLARKN